MFHLNKQHLIQFKTSDIDKFTEPTAKKFPTTNKTGLTKDFN